MNGAESLVRTLVTGGVPYSPDFNPIEPAWSKVKQLLRGAKARTLEVLETSVSQALSAITPGNASAWFTHCGYAL